MAVSDTSDLDAAILATLNGDATLAAQVVDGWYYDAAPPNVQRFGIVSRIPSGPTDVPTFGGRAFEDHEFLIKVVMRTTAGGDIKAAAARVDALLDDQPLTAPGYAWMTVHRTEFVRITEVDDIDPLIRWLHRGGRYRVQFALT